MGLWFDLQVFLASGWNIALVLIAFVLAGLFIVGAYTSKKRQYFLYAHVAALLFPFLLFFLTTTCQALFSRCNTGTAVLYISVMSLGGSFVLMLIITPILYIKRIMQRSKRLPDKDRLVRFVRRYSSADVFIVDEARPEAYSSSIGKDRIFISAGMLDVLDQKEVEAVLLHEIYHISRRSSAIKISQELFRRISPVAWFFTHNSCVDEAEADAFAEEKQDTGRFLESAKQKIMHYTSSSSSSGFISP